MSDKKLELIEQELSRIYNALMIISQEFSKNNVIEGAIGLGMLISKVASFIESDKSQS